MGLVGDPLLINRHWKIKGLERQLDRCTREGIPDFYNDRALGEKSTGAAGQTLALMRMGLF